jgi:hypothetical protein
LLLRRSRLYGGRLLPGGRLLGVCLQPGAKDEKSCAAKKPGSEVSSPSDFVHCSTPHNTPPQGRGFTVRLRLAGGHEGWLAGKSPRRERRGRLLHP